MDEFSPEDLHALIDSVLETEPVSETEPESEVDTVSDSVVPFGAVDTFLLAELWPRLTEQMPVDTAQNVLAQLRDKLYYPKLSVRQLHGVISNCRRCPGVDGPPALATGNLVNPELVVVSATAPTAELTKTALGEAGFDPAKVALTFAVRCRGATDNELVRENCSHHLFSELELLKPRLIVCVGAGPTALLLGETEPMTSIHGRVFWNGPWAVMGVYSPGWLNRNETRIPEFMADFTAAKSFLGS